MALSYKHLAAVHNLQCDHDKALELLRTSVDMTIQALGPEHASVATSYNTMARMFRWQGRHKEAAALLEKVELLKKLEAMKRRS